jgi:hypothetical protein
MGTTMAPDVYLRQRGTINHVKPDANASSTNGSRKIICNVLCLALRYA